MEIYEACILLIRAFPSSYIDTQLYRGASDGEHHYHKMLWYS